MGACGNLSPIEKCLAIIAHGKDALQDGNFALAERAFRLAQAVGKALPPEEGRDLIPLVLLNLSRLRQRQGRDTESRQLREEAYGQLEQNVPSLPYGFYHLWLAKLLREFGEYRRAIPFYEQAIQLDDSKSPIDLAQMLWRVGECYNRIGLKDHAAIPLRASLKTFRKHPEDPRLPAVLIALGNALRKTAPGEAESCYREAAEWNVARGKLLSATPAWGNIAILCCEDGRYGESLEYFARVQKIREQSPGVGIAAIALTHNNMVNCYRRMGMFAEAFTAVSHAIDLLHETGGPELASAYGTRGLIFLDQGQDSDAVEWLRRAYEHYQTLPSPNLGTMEEDLKREIEALRRLGRVEEVKQAEVRMGLLETAKSTVPHVGRDLSGLDAPMQCAVFVELNCRISETNHENAKLGRRLSEVLEVGEVGCYAGRLTAPEGTTLIFYGPDAEALFHVLEPGLAHEPVCAGARITIRQRDGQRELMLPSRLT